MPNTTSTTSKLVSVLVGFALGAAAVSGLGSAQAEPQPAFDRSLVERVVRAQEAQARAQEQQTHVLEALARSVERCKP